VCYHAPVRVRADPNQRLQPAVNLAMAIGQDIIAVFLIVAILLQARGSGLSATFGGDSSVYRSRRGIERRLWQFTILLAILFCGFSIVGYIVKV
jgi:preprotein translocase subunit SecG